MKEELNKDKENLRKKESNRNPGNKKPLSSNKKYSGRPLSRLEVEDKISGLKDKIILKKKQKNS
jgi:hypothetical protein